jgi:dihydrofolate synthase/folylpolyglutamate synthase
MPVTPALNLGIRPRGRIRPELESLRRVLAGLGNPQLAFPSILIVGTNGKGSTAVMLEAILRAHGLRTALFTSPHLVRVEERVRLDFEPVDGALLGEHIGRLDEFPDLTYFETLTAAAFTVFSESRVDVAVLEAGMGGSWDATRLAGSAIAGLTNVGSDHAGWLGAAPSLVARDKGRALAAAERSVFGAGVDEALVDELGAEKARPARSLVRCSAEIPGRALVGWDGDEAMVRLPLPGAFQLENLQLAVALALEVAGAGWMTELDSTRLRTALKDLRWPGRLSAHRIAGHDVLADCAHNLEAAEALGRHLDTLDRRYNLLFSCLDDKPVESIAKVLRPRVDDVIVCRLEDDRAMPATRLAAAFPGAMVAEDPRSALVRLHDPVLATGSIRLVGALLALNDAEVVG